MVVKSTYIISKDEPTAEGIKAIAIEILLDCESNERNYSIARGVAKKNKHGKYFLVDQLNSKNSYVGDWLQASVISNLSIGELLDKIVYYDEERYFDTPKHIEGLEKDIAFN